MPAAATAARVLASIDRPATLWSTLGVVDFIRVPSPAARIIANPEGVERGCSEVMSSSVGARWPGNRGQ